MSYLLGGALAWLVLALVFGWALGTAIRRADEELARRSKDR